MGVTRLMSTLLKHPATKDAVIENVPLFECLMVDYNANIHYVLQKTITELNEILYFTYHNKKMLQIPQQLLGPAEYNSNLQMSVEDLEDRIEYYNDEYSIGTTYTDIHKSMTEETITDIVFMEVINYTRGLICSLNRGNIKKIFLSLDGIPSMAKIKEQRNRRYMGAHLNNIVNDVIKKFKLKNADIYQIDIFYYRSAICTGTKFMEKIQQALFHLDINTGIINNESSNIEIIVSTINIKGEGEKKIIHAIDEYIVDNDSFCIMSPDSDMLILIGLLSSNTKFATKQMYNFRINYQKNNQYQFFDLNQLIINFQKYFSDRIGKVITKDKMLDLFFMLVVFGNDFLPKLEPLDITQHFDFVCETCLEISMSGTQFITNNNLNYQYLIDFFKKINQDIIPLSIEHSLHNKYNNYQKLCSQISITKEDLTDFYHHRSLKAININYLNFDTQMKILVEAFYKFFNFLKCNRIRKEDINMLYKDIHKNLNDSYLMLVLPKLLKFPGSDKFRNATPRAFFDQFVQYMNMNNNFAAVKFRNKLMPREYTYNNRININNQGTITAYLEEMEKINKSMEPYRSIFKMDSIELVTFNIESGQIIDLRNKYYDTYIKNNITEKEIDAIVLDYIVGIDWLYNYYIIGTHSEWQYNQSQPPLIDDIIRYLETKPDFQHEITTILASISENNMTPHEHYLYVTPNEYTNAGVSPNLSDVLHLIDGYGALYLNKCQIKWHEYDTISIK